jgi:predicted nucleic acid-binding protein
MAKPKIYIDACCIIEALKGRKRVPLDHPPQEVDMVERILRAANEDEISLYTSMITVAEVLHIGTKPPPPDLKLYVERLILSGRNGITAIAPSPPIVLLARDLATDEGLWERVADRIHVATALHAGAREFLSIDGRLAKRIGQSQVRKCRIISPSATTLLPSQYLANDLFKNQPPA